MRSCSIIILTYNGRDLLAEGIPSVIEAVRQAGGDHEIMIVDNASSDDSVEFVRRNFPSVRILPLDRNYRFVGGNNRGILAARHDIVVLLNNDMVVDRNFLNPLLAGFSDESVFAVTSQIFFQEKGKRREETGKTGFFWDKGMLYAYHEEVDSLDLERRYVPTVWAGGGSAAYDRRKFIALGMFDELYLPCYVDDLDLSYAAWGRGWKSLFCAASIVYHKHRATHVRQFTPEELDVIIAAHQLLFLWKNLTSPVLLLSHFFFLPFHILNQIRRERKTTLLKAVASAARRAPKAIRSRFVRRPPRLISDRALLRGRYIRRSIGSGQQRLRVLFVCPYMPCLGSNAGANRMFEIIRHLAARHAVSVITFYDEDSKTAHIPELQEFCTKVIAVRRRPSLRAPSWFHIKPKDLLREFATPEMKAALRKEMRSNDFDIAQFEYLQTAQLVDIAVRFNVATAVTEHEVPARKLWRDLRHAGAPEKLDLFYQWMVMLRYQDSIYARFDSLAALTPEDSKYIARFNPRLRVYTLPMGVDLSYFRPDSSPPDRHTLLFTGYFRHTPNVDAMQYFVRDVLPGVRTRFPDVRTYIVGGEVPRELRELESHAGVTVTGWVDDIRPYYRRATVFVAPLRLGTGMRGKVLEAWAMKCPVVTTPVGAEGYDCRSGHELLIADDAGGFAEAVIRLLEDPALRSQMADRGYAKAHADYSWSAIGCRYEQMYRQMMQEHSAPRS